MLEGLAAMQEKRRRLIMEATGATEAQMRDAERRSAEFSARLDAKSMELYGSPFHKLPESHAGRVRSEAAREDACEREPLPQGPYAHLYTADELKAWQDGYHSGRADRRLGLRSTYAWSQLNSVSTYPRYYSRGYQAGWFASRPVF